MKWTWVFLFKSITVGLTVTSAFTCNGPAHLTAILLPVGPLALHPGPSTRSLQVGGSEVGNEAVE